MVTRKRFGVREDKWLNDWQNIAIIKSGLTNWLEHLPKKKNKWSECNEPGIRMCLINKVLNRAHGVATKHYFTLILVTFIRIQVFLMIIFIVTQSFGKGNKEKQNLHILSTNRTSRWGTHLFNIFSLAPFQWLSWMDGQLSTLIQWLTCFEW